MTLERKIIEQFIQASTLSPSQLAVRLNVPLSEINAALSTLNDRDLAAPRTNRRLMTRPFSAEQQPWGIVT